MFLSVGEILVDVFIDEGKRLALPGGAPFNLACNAASYTEGVHFVGCVGKDEEGDLLLEAAKSSHLTGYQIIRSSTSPTTKAIVTLVDGERFFRFERDPGADYQLELGQIDPARLRQGGIAHIGSLMLSVEEGRRFFHDFVAKVREYPSTLLSFDINYRDDIFPSAAAAKEVFLEALTHADVLKFSNDELTYLSQEQDLEKGLAKLLRPDQMAVVTLGKDGSMFYHNGTCIHEASIPVHPVDTTGAGDAFYSYFLATLHNDPTFVEDETKIRQCLRRANAVGAMATLRKGAIGVAPSLAELEAFLAK